MSDLIVKHDISNEGIADALEKCDWAGASIGNKAILQLAIQALRNTRADAPVDGLETVEYHYFNSTQGTWLPCAFPEMARKEGKETRELVTRSQAVAIIAAKDVAISNFQGCLAASNNVIDGLQANNAALTARVKEVEETKDVIAADKKTLLDLAATNGDKVTALETQLSAAKEIAQEVLSLIAGDVSIPAHIRDKARAALEGKP